MFNRLLTFTRIVHTIPARGAMRLVRVLIGEVLFLPRPGFLQSAGSAFSNFLAQELEIRFAIIENERFHIAFH